MRIRNITALEILDSRGNPTLRTYVHLDNGIVGVASVPSGASTGSHEAIELRDGDEKRFHGKGVLNAKHNVEAELAPLLKGKDASEHDEIDKIMIEADGTENKSRLGANSILSISLACADASAKFQRKPLYKYLAPLFGTTSFELPVPLINVINGGKHALHSSDIQEYMLIPYGFAAFSEALRASTEVFYTLSKKIAHMGQPTTVGDEGGFAPHTQDNDIPLQLLVSAIEDAGYIPGEEFGLGIDAAASELFKDTIYHLSINNVDLTSKELSQYYARLTDKYPLCSIEDPFSEDDWDAWKMFDSKYKEKVQIVGDDLYVTNNKRLQKGIREKSSNAILVKLNQIGTLTETVRVIRMAQEHNMQVIISHRSGETCDTFIADFAVAANAGQIKTGGLSRSERLSKYNRLLEIESIQKDAVFASFPYKYISL